MLLFCHLEVNDVACEWRMSSAGNRGNIRTTSIFIIEQSRISCTQPHRKDKDCQKSRPWLKAQLTLVALLPFWICSFRRDVLFYFTNNSTEMFRSRSMILKGGAKSTQFYISDLKIRAQTTCYGKMLLAWLKRHPSFWNSKFLPWNSSHSYISIVGILNTSSASFQLYPRYSFIVILTYNH